MDTKMKNEKSPAARPRQTAGTGPCVAVAEEDRQPVGAPCESAAREKRRLPADAGQWDFHTTTADKRGRHMLEISAALSAMNAAWTGLKGAIAVRDERQIAAALQSLQEKMLEMTISASQVAEQSASQAEKLYAVQGELRDTLERLRQAEAKAAKDAEYVLSELASGVWAYKHQPSVDAGKPPHYLCANCMNAGKHSVLQEGSAYGSVYLRCVPCEYDHYTDRTVPYNL